MTRKKIGAFCLSFLGVAPLIAAAEGLSLVPVRDNTLIQWSPETPGENPLLSNGLGDIFVGRTNQDGQEPATISIRRGLIQFDIAGAVPNGMKITGATLIMRDVRGLNGDPIVSLHRVLQDWGEGSSHFEGGQGAPATNGDVTWLHAVYDAANPLASDFWNTPGSNYEPMASAETVIFDDLGDGQFFTWSSEEMVADLQAWLNQPGKNFGWILIGDETRGQSAKRLNSREATESPPLLEIEFEPVFPGDYNDDGRVSAADYTVWRDNLGGTSGLVNETATLGHVTSEDYDVWKSHYGAILEEATGLAMLPEPSTGTLAIVAAFLTRSLITRSVYHLGGV